MAQDELNFSRLAGYALIAFAVMGPLAYCSAHLDGPGNALVLECIKARGEWKTGGWSESSRCEFPKSTTQPQKP